MTTPDPKQDTSLASPDPTKLADWLPILQLPEVGERVCEAAGVEHTLDNCVVLFDGNEWEFEAEIPVMLTAALTFGGLAVLAEGEADLLIGHQDSVWIVEWWNRDQDIRHQKGHSTYPAAVLAALYRVHGPFGDGG